MDTLIPSFQYVNSIEKVDASACIKSIRLTSNVCTIAIYHPETKDIHLINTYNIDPSLKENEIVSWISEINNKLNIPCQKNVFYIYTKSNTQIPKEYYEEKEINHILSLIYPEDPQGKACPEFVDVYELYNLTKCNQTLLGSIQSLLPEFEIKTHISTLFTLLSRIQEKENTALIFIENMHFTILASHNHNFLGANGLNFTKESDFVYYTVDFLRKIYPSSEPVFLYICGNIEEQSPIFSLTKKYIKNLSILKQTNSSELDNYHYFSDIIL